MSFYLKSKKLDFYTGDEPVAVINVKEAENYGIMPGDHIQLQWSKNRKLVVDAQFTSSKVKPGEIGLFKEVWKDRVFIEAGDIVEVTLLSRPASIQAIKKKLLGKSLNYQETLAIISDIVSGKLTSVETTYFVTAGFLQEFTNEELYFLTKAIAETGEQMNLKHSALDKHSVGGLPGNRTTMVVIPIIASLGLYIPKSSSRAITSPAGTADTMEILCPVSFSLEKIRAIVEKAKACLVWGGSLNMAPADDKIIKLSRPLSLEPYDKMIVSIMAKKVAMGVDYLVIDMPVGPTTKIPNNRIARVIESKFLYLGKRFGMKVKVIKTQAREPIGRGVGPALEARDALRVLQQKDLRPKDLEKKSVYLAGELLELAGFCKKGRGKEQAQKALSSGAAWGKMQEIISLQGGNADIDSDEVALGALNYEIHAPKSGRIDYIDNGAVNNICRNLGAPREKIAGIHFHARWRQKVKKGDKLFTIYAQSKDRIELAIKALEKNKVVVIE